MQQGNTKAFQDVGGCVDTGHSSPVPTGLSKTTVDALASELGKRFNFKYGAPIEDLVDTLGGEIVYQDATEWYTSESGSIVVDGVADFIIYLSNFTGALRNRFTIAHELGHYFLHYLYQPEPERKKIKAQRFLPAVRTIEDEQVQRAEWEANWFAGGLLMPAKDFIRSFKSGDDLDMLAARFLVSRSAVETRIKTLRDRL